MTSMIGLYYVCYQLAKRGWNVMPTSRNAKGVDVIIYNHDASKRHTIQVKSLSKRSAVNFSDLDTLRMSDYLIVCRTVYSDAPEVFITSSNDIVGKIRIDTNEKGNKSYWLEYREYEKFPNVWSTIESSNSAS